MRIALVNTLYSPLVVGGAARSVEELAAALAGDGHEVLVATLGPEDRRIDADPQPDGVYVDRIAASASFEPFDTTTPDLSPLRKLAWHAHEARRADIEQRLSSAFDKFAADVVHTNNIAGFGLSAWRAAKGRPLVHTMRDYYLLCVRSALFRDGQVCVKQCSSCSTLKAPVRVARRRPDVFVGVSQAVVDQHLRFKAIRSGDRTEVVYNWPQISPAPRDNTTDRPFTFGMLGRMGTDKGTWVALEAFAALPAAVKAGVRLLLAGHIPDSDRDRFEAFVAAEPTASYRGASVSAAGFYAETDCVLLPAQWMEPFGRVAAEALLAGCSVVASRIGGLPEAVEHFGGGLFVDDPTSPLAWSAAMLAAAAAGPGVAKADPPQGTPVHESYLAIYQGLQTPRSS